MVILHTSISSIPWSLWLAVILFCSVFVLLKILHTNQKKTLQDVKKIAVNKPYKEIIITQRSRTIYACLKDRPEIEGNGKNQYEAIGNLIMHHSELFNITLNFKE